MIDLGEKAHQRAESDRERLIIEQDVRAYIDTEIGDVIYNDLQELNQENLMQNIDDIYMDAYNILAEGELETLAFSLLVSTKISATASINSDCASRILVL